jgi:chaperone BCS1
MEDFGAKNQAYLPPPVEEHIATSQHSAKPLDNATLGLLAKKFADSIPEEEFSVAALQGCELLYFFLRSFSWRWPYWIEISASYHKNLLIVPVRA